MHFLPKKANWHVPESRNVPHSLNLLAEENARHSRWFQVRQQWVVSMVIGTMTVWHPIRQPPVTGVPWSCQHTQTMTHYRNNNQFKKNIFGCSGTSTTNVMHCCQKGAYKCVSCRCWIRTGITEHHPRDFVWWGRSAEWALEVARGWAAGTSGTETVPPRLAQMTGQHKNTAHTKKCLSPITLHTFSMPSANQKTVFSRIFLIYSFSPVSVKCHSVWELDRTVDPSTKDLRYQSSKALSQMTNHIKHVKSEGFIVHTFKTLHIEFYEKAANGSFFVGTYTKCL